MALTFEEMTARLEQTITNPVRVIERKTRGPNTREAKKRVQLPAEWLELLVPADGEESTTFNKTFSDGQVARFVINHLRTENKANGRGLKVTWIDPDDGTKTLPVAHAEPTGETTVNKKGETVDKTRQVDDLAKSTVPVEIQFWSGPKNEKLTGRLTDEEKARRAAEATPEAAPEAVASNGKGRAKKGAPAEDPILSELGV